MTALEIVYIICFVFGLAYAVISTVFGGIHADGGFDAPGDASGSMHADIGHDSGTMHFSPLSPVVIAMFLTAFGAAGMICLKAFKLPIYYGLTIAVLVGLAVAAVTFFIFVTLFSKTQGSSESNVASIIGKEAEVITPIPADGVGEIAYISKGARYTAPARSALQTDIRSHTIVTVDKIVGNMFIVKASE
ncbi:MAG: NfeD family protein [Deltaproteobacteria bacterium]|nr:NfeD family protein [Deltaproteobacteria bacterium]